ncbi:Phosphatidylinositol 4-kinase [Tieghemiomyces parasiticus]|uniref:Phosphatidylinositol 4-kinase n=1 Tax=Tieghemiomyces parasiticus TaxID=78921 RepID=A0A9W8DYV8_9FUNG|nr:Phosphatidylinositol 4-kinase [Tieghemiomyces parasiticus]
MASTRARLADTLRRTVRFARRRPFYRRPRSTRARAVLFSVFRPLANDERTWCLQHTPAHLPGATPTASDFAALVQAVRTAIEAGVSPRRIAQGSSGSYFCRDPDGTVVGVFKPRDEEPFSQLNPKWTKWLHRNLCPCMFGRSCLIPNLGYLSEAMASLVDRRLGLGLVPRTEVVELASDRFHYRRRDRWAAQRTRSPRPLPPKPGSLQTFLTDFTDASTFLARHPWPTDSGQATTPQVRPVTVPGAKTPLHATDAGSGGRYGAVASEIGSAPVPRAPLVEEVGDPFGRSLPAGAIGRSAESTPASPRPTRPVTLPPPAFRWTEALRHQFRVQLEALVILDYLIRNTDRGNDNWMIRYCPGPDCALDRSAARVLPHLHLAAIDNGLAFPFKHPDQWRSYPYAWLALPSAMVAGGFLPSTRAHFLPRLTSPVWWRATVDGLAALAACDPDFNRRMFDRQISVMKGQAWNLVRALRDQRSGPLELAELPPVTISTDEVADELQCHWLLCEGPGQSTSPVAAPPDYQVLKTGDIGRPVGAEMLQSRLSYSNLPLIVGRPTVGAGDLPPRATGEESADRSADTLSLASGDATPPFRPYVTRRYSVPVPAPSRHDHWPHPGPATTDPSPRSSLASDSGDEPLVSMPKVLMERVEPAPRRPWLTCW